MSVYSIMADIAQLPGNMIHWGSAPTIEWILTEWKKCEFQLPHKGIDSGKQSLFFSLTEGECLSERPKSTPIIRHNLKYLNSTLFLMIFSILEFWKIRSEL
jgi:hypothetical protein